MQSFSSSSANIRTCLRSLPSPNWKGEDLKTLSTQSCTAATVLGSSIALADRRCMRPSLVRERPPRGFDRPGMPAGSLATKQRATFAIADKSRAGVPRIAGQSNGRSPRLHPLADSASGAPRCMPGAIAVWKLFQNTLRWQLYCHPAAGDKGWQYNCHPNCSGVEPVSSRNRQCVLLAD